MDKKFVNPVPETEFACQTVNQTMQKTIRKAQIDQVSIQQVGLPLSQYPDRVSQFQGFLLLQLDADCLHGTQDLASAVTSSAVSLSASLT